MSTYYDFNESNWMDELKMHYSHNEGVDLDKMTVCTSDDFCEDDIKFVADVFVGDVKNTYIVTFEDDDHMTIFEMTTTEFKSEWSEKVWAKLREDNYVVCPVCGEKKAEFVAGKHCLGSYFKQFYCNAHHDAYIMDGARFVREGVLH